MPVTTANGVSTSHIAGKDWHFLIECGLPDREGGNLRGYRLARLLFGGDNEGRRSSSSPRDPWSQSGAVVGVAQPGLLDVKETRKLQKRPIEKRRACNSLTLQGCVQISSSSKGGKTTRPTRFQREPRPETSRIRLQFLARSCLARVKGSLSRPPTRNVPRSCFFSFSVLRSSACVLFFEAARGFWQLQILDDAQNFGHRNHRPTSG